MLNFGRVLKSYGGKNFPTFFILGKKTNTIWAEKTAGPTVGGNQKSGVKTSWYMVKYYPHYVQG